MWEANLKICGKQGEICYFLISLNQSLNLEKTQPNPTQPTQLGTNLFSAKSRQIFTKLSGYFPNHIPTWSMMSKMIPSSKSPIRNPQCPSSPQLRTFQPNHVRSWSNFQDRPLSNHLHHLWCSTQDDPILQVPSQEPSISLKPPT